MTTKQDRISAIGGQQLGGLSPLSIAKAIWNHRFIGIVVWLLLMAAVVLIVRRLPSVYRAETSILVESQRIPETYVSATVAPNLQDRLNAISDQILSYSRLSDLIQRFDLYRKERRHRTMEEIVDMMRSDIKITADKSALGSDGHPAAFQISYQGPNPETVAQVAQQIGSFFIDENVRERSIEAEGTSQFLESQLAEAKRRLEEQEAMLSRYKLEHSGELPEQENALLASSGQMKTELTGIQDALNRAQQNKTMLQASLSDARMAEAAFGQMLKQAAPVPAGGTAVQADFPPQTESERLEAQLAVLRGRYGDEYPDVRHLKEQLAQARAAEKKMALSPAKPPAAGNPGQASAAALVQTSHSSPQSLQTLIASKSRITDLTAQIAAANTEIASLEKQRQGILRDLSALESHIAELPVREQQLASVTRDYETTKAAYQSLLDKKLSADVAADMEKRQKAERFVMLDAARVPQKPIKPKRELLDAGGCIAALAVAILLALGLELRKGVLLGEWEIPSSVTILGRIPVMALAAPAEEGRTQ
jgi:succinoglycan biosynthesis transport protein ExoP